MATTNIQELLTQGLFTQPAQQPTVDPRARLTGMELLTSEALKAGDEAAGLFTEGGNLLRRELIGLTPEEEAQENLMQDVSNFDNLTTKEQEGVVLGLQALGETAVAGQLASRLKALEGARQAKLNAETVSSSLPSEYAGLARAIEQGVPNAIQKGIDILSREQKTPPKVNRKIVNLVNTETNETVGTAVEVDGQLFNSQGQLMSPEELEGLGISASYVKPTTPLVSMAADPKAKLAAEMRTKLFTPLTTVAESTAETAKTAVDEKRTAEMALAAVDTNAVTGAVAAVGFDLAQIGQDVFQNLGIPVPKGWSELTNSKAQYQTISAQALKPQIEKQGKGFTDKDREFFLKDVLPSYKQAWQFNELSGNLQREGAILKIAEAGFADSRNIWHVESNTTPKQAHAVVWDDYLTKLPYNKLKKNAKKMVGSQEVTYDKYHTMTDASSLWQYWASGQEPTGFTLIDAEGNPVDYTFYELNNLEGFEGKTAREILQLFDNADRLSGAIYK